MVKNGGNHRRWQRHRQLCVLSLSPFLLKKLCELCGFIDKYQLIPPLFSAFQSKNIFSCFSDVPEKSKKLLTRLSGVPERSKKLLAILSEVPENAKMPLAILSGSPENVKMPLMLFSGSPEW